MNNIESTDTNINPISVSEIADARIFESRSPTVIPPVVPVTEIIGTPIVNMPGCVKVHKENAKNPKNRNKMLKECDNAFSEIITTLKERKNEMIC